MSTAIGMLCIFALSTRDQKYTTSSAVAGSSTCSRQHVMASCKCSRQKRRTLAAARVAADLAIAESLAIIGGCKCRRQCSARLAAARAAANSAGSRQA